MAAASASDRPQESTPGDKPLFSGGAPSNEPCDDLPMPETDDPQEFGRGFQCTRASMHCLFSTFSHVAMLGDGSVTTNTTMGGQRDALTIVPKDGFEENRVIMYLHGGGHCMGTPWLNRSIAVNLAKTCRAKVFSLAYRLAPENPYPAGLDDTYQAYQWLRQQFPNASIAIAGASAGGNLCFALLIKLAQMGERQPIACIGISPWLLLKRPPSATQDLSNFAKKQGAKCVWSYCQGHPASDPLVSPLLVSDHDVKKFPPVLMHGSEEEFLASDIRDMEKRCSDNGIAVEAKLFPGKTHVFQQHKNSRPTKDSIGAMGSFLSGLW